MKDLKKALNLEEAQTNGSDWLVSSKTGIHPGYNTYWTTLYKQYIEQGDVEKFEHLLQDVIMNGLPIPVGKLSENSLRQTRYLAIVVLSSGANAAIKGGLTEVIGRALSDSIIQQIDKTSDENRILSLLVEGLSYLVKAVRDCRRSKVSHPSVKKVIEYIHAHLGDSLALPTLSQVSGLSPAYLSTLFKQECVFPFPYIFASIRLMLPGLCLKNGTLPNRKQPPSLGSVPRAILSVRSSWKQE